MLVGGGSIALGVLVWVVVGRSLRPVDAMRRTVDGFDHDHLDQRLPIPGTHDELDDLAQTLNSLLARLEEAVDREHRFVADASHELRSPIAAMRTLLETEANDPDLVVLTRADALARLDQFQVLADQLLSLHRLSSEPLRAPEAVDLDDLVMAFAHRLATTTALRVDTSGVSGGQVLGNEPDLARLVDNLTTNAARYAATTVELTVQESDSSVVMTVGDDGPGIAPEDRARIFERFATLDEARSPGVSGAGLGLSIAAAITAAHHGRIEVTDRPGGGARFTITFPRPRARPDANPEEPHGQARPSTDARTARVRT